MPFCQLLQEGPEPEAPTVESLLRAAQCQTAGVQRTLDLESLLAKLQSGNGAADYIRLLPAQVSSLVQSNNGRRKETLPKCC